MSIGKVPESLTSFFKKNNDFHSYIIRIANLYHNLSVKLGLSNTGMKYKGANIWNSIAPEEINLEVSEAVFKKKSYQNDQQWYFVKYAVFCRLTISRSLWSAPFCYYAYDQDMFIRFGSHTRSWVVATYTKLRDTNDWFPCCVAILD